MDSVLERLAALSPDELRGELIKAGLKCGPVTATTRGLFEKKLARAIQEKQGAGSSTSETDCSAPPGLGQVEQLQGDPQAPSKEGDLGLNPPEEEALTSTVDELGSQADGQSPHTPPQGSPPLYYGVCPLWEDGVPKNDKVHVFTNKKQALKAARNMKGARFKGFPSQEEAEKFAKGICDYCPSSSKPEADVSPEKLDVAHHKDSAPPLGTEAINRERANNFQTPRTQDLTAKLRKAVEKGDQAAFSDLVWSNPRYLIGSGDNPTVVQEGCRYNVLHVAAKENQAGIAQLVLDILENPEFMRLMYPDDQETMLLERIRYIVDLYLNTPDKASCETPLHFACKFGCPEVVNVLCSHPDTDKNCKNKYGQKPSSVICERKNKSQEIRQKIKDYLEDRCYIPLLRATDNSSQPVIGTPLTHEPLECIPCPPMPTPTGSPTDPVMAVSAFAGPLSPSKAEEFRRMWKTPPRHRAKDFHCIQKSDPDRGAERVGRELAHELGLPWAEYWDFLHCFLDLSSSEGLQRLEEYLSGKDVSEHSQEENEDSDTSSQLRTPSSGKSKNKSNSISVGVFLDEEGEVSLEEMKNKQKSALSTDPSVRVTEEAATRKVAESNVLTDQKRDLLSPSRSCVGLRSSSDCPPNEEQSNPESPGTSPPIVSNLMVEFERMYKEGSHSGHSENGDPSASGVLSRGSQLLLSATDNAVLEPGDLDLRGGGCWGSERRDAELEEEGRSRSSSSSEEYFSASEDTDIPRTAVLGSGRAISANPRSCYLGGQDLSSSSSCSSSYKSTENWQEDFILKTPSHSRTTLFIEGDSPSRLDREVLMALEAIEIDPQTYPSIHLWKSTVQAYPSTERKSWPSPQGVKSTSDSPFTGVHSTPRRFGPAQTASSPDFTSPHRYSTAHASSVQHTSARTLSL
ncbi:ankyrin repeat and LEM domain-containing protein 2-like [Megalops cyprinoides]|uniref:ankyrin repeat and LEM domain-containing protein 2-like n=1 Tax=Megalops cyprinoides TaxID=118141 RepID=UPI001863BBBA|nr:ankyrin repeat and LEM domain-containing protein 2-like [Megalops cyprinoides]